MQSTKRRLQGHDVRRPSAGHAQGRQGEVCLRRRESARHSCRSVSLYLFTLASGYDTDAIFCVVGTCHPPSPVYEARAAALAAGFPQETPVQAINRLCSSGLMAIRSISDSIARGDIDIGLAVGYESMTKKYVSLTPKRSTHLTSLRLVPDLRRYSKATRSKIIK